MNFLSQKVSGLWDSLESQSRYSRKERSEKREDMGNCLGEEQIEPEPRLTSNILPGIGKRVSNVFSSFTNSVEELLSTGDDLDEPSSIYNPDTRSIGVPRKRSRSPHHQSISDRRRAKRTVEPERNQEIQFSDGEKIIIEEVDMDSWSSIDDNKSNRYEKIGKFEGGSGVCVVWNAVDEKVSD